MATEGTPLKRRRLNSTPDNAVHGQSRIVKRQRRRHADPNLLRTVLLRDRPTISQPSHGLCEFEFSESQICFGDIIETRDHAIVFRITANGRTFALKLHMYDPDAVSDLAYPKSNPFFDCESLAYARLSNLQTEIGPPVPKCYGYINLTKPPQRQSRQPRHLFHSTLYRPAVYLDFINQPTEEATDQERSSEKAEQDRQWREYFRNKSHKCILRGLIIEEVIGQSLRSIDTPYHLLTQLGQEALQRIHMAGVLQGDVENASDNVLVTLAPNMVRERIVWIDFSKALSSSCIDKRKFAKKASIERQLWSQMFKE